MCLDVSLRATLQEQMESGVYTLSPRSDQGGGQSLEVWAGVTPACPVPSGWDLDKDGRRCRPSYLCCTLASGPLDAQGWIIQTFESQVRIRDIILRATGSTPKGFLVKRINSGFRRFKGVNGVTLERKKREGLGECCRNSKQTWWQFTFENQEKVRRRNKHNHGCSMELEKARDQGSLFRLLSPVTGGEWCSLLGQGTGQRFSFGGRWGGLGEETTDTSSSLPLRHPSSDAKQAIG